MISILIYYALAAATMGVTAKVLDKVPDDSCPEDKYNPHPYGENNGPDGMPYGSPYDG